MRQLQHLIRKRIRLLACSGLALSVIGAFLGGCSQPAKVSAPAQPAANVQKQPIVTAPTPTQPAIEEKLPVYAYNPGGRRDPFAPIIEKENKKVKTGDRPPLERYNVSEFKLSGIVWGGFGYNAMLEGPDGKGYFVRVGTILGLNRGVVRKITQTSLVIEETYKTYTGETKHKEIIVELGKKQEATP